MIEKVGAILPPKKPSIIPDASQWVSGQGCGVWFSIELTSKEGVFNIKRFNPEGELDCDRLFKVEENGTKFDINKPYKFVHVSHCSRCRIVQGEVVYVFNFNEKL